MLCHFMVVKMGGTEEGGWEDGSGAGAALGYAPSLTKESSWSTARGTVC